MADELGEGLEARQTGDKGLERPGKLGEGLEAGQANWEKGWRPGKLSKQNETYILIEANETGRGIDEEEMKCMKMIDTHERDGTLGKAISHVQ